MVVEMVTAIAGFAGLAIGFAPRLLPLKGLRDIMKKVLLPLFIIAILLGLWLGVIFGMTQITDFITQWDWLVALLTGLGVGGILATIIG